MKRCHNGDVFQGKWINATQFSGVVTFASGAVYTGNCEHDQMHGLGTLNSIDGERYSGCFGFGVKSGHGTQTLSK